MNLLILNAINNELKLNKSIDVSSINETLKQQALVLIIPYSDVSTATSHFHPKQVFVIKQSVIETSLVDSLGGLDFLFTKAFYFDSRWNEHVPTSLGAWIFSRAIPKCVVDFSLLHQKIQRTEFYLPKSCLESRFKPSENFLFNVYAKNPPVLLFTCRIIEITRKEILCVKLN